MKYTVLTQHDTRDIKRLLERCQELLALQSKMEAVVNTSIDHDLHPETKLLGRVLEAQYLRLTTRASDPTAVVYEHAWQLITGDSLGQAYLYCPKCTCRVIWDKISSTQPPELPKIGCPILSPEDEDN